MRDDFELLGEARRPWIDPETLRLKFLALSTEVHPDRYHNSSAQEREAATRRYTDLNGAYNRLRDPRDRLLHLLELELGSKPQAVREPPPNMIEVGFQVGQLCRQVDEFLSQQARFSSPMLKAQQFQKAQDWSDRMNTLKKQLTEHQEQLVAELKTLNPAWQQAPAQDEARRATLPMDRLEETYTLLSYLNRWISQLGERTVQLFL